MKAVLCFALAVIVVVGACRALTVCPCPEKPTLGEKILRFVAFRWVVKRIFGNEQLPPAPAPVQSEPPSAEAIAGQQIQNGPMQNVGTQRSPQIDHGAGW